MKGIFHIQITEDENGTPRVVGDSGWRNNQITNTGKVNFLAELLGGISGSSQIGWAALGTGTAPASNGSTLPGELSGTGLRMAVTPSTVVNAGSTAVQFLFTLNSGMTAATGNISNVGLFAISNTTSGQIFAGNTYASSALASNNNVAGTYIINFP